MHQSAVRRARPLAPCRRHSGDYSRRPLPKLRRFPAQRAPTAHAAIPDAPPCFGDGASGDVAALKGLKVRSGRRAAGPIAPTQLDAVSGEYLTASYTNERLYFSSETL